MARRLVRVPPASASDDRKARVDGNPCGSSAADASVGQDSVRLTAGADALALIGASATDNPRRK